MEITIKLQLEKHQRMLLESSILAKLQTTRIEINRIERELNQKAVTLVPRKALEQYYDSLNQLLQIYEAISEQI